MPQAHASFTPSVMRMGQRVRYVRNIPLDVQQKQQQKREQLVKDRQGEEKEGEAAEGHDVVRSPSDKMQITFTCTVCDLRSTKQMSRAAYTTGVCVCVCVCVCVQE